MSYEIPNMEMGPPNLDLDPYREKRPHPDAMTVETALCILKANRVVFEVARNQRIFTVPYLLKVLLNLEQEYNHYYISPGANDFVKTGKPRLPKNPLSYYARATFIDPLKVARENKMSFSGILK